MRSPKEVEKEEYNRFYKGAFKGEFMDPMAYTHFTTEVGGWGWDGDGMEWDVDDMGRDEIDSQFWCDCL